LLARLAHCMAPTCAWARACVGQHGMCLLKTQSADCSAQRLGMLGHARPQPKAAQRLRTWAAHRPACAHAALHGRSAQHLRSRPCTAPAAACFESWCSPGLRRSTCAAAGVNRGCAGHPAPARHEAHPLRHQARERAPEGMGAPVSGMYALGTFCSCANACAQA